MRLVRPLFAALALVLLSVPVLAEPPPGAGPPDEELRARLRMMQMYALTEALDLDEATAAKLFPYLKEGDEALAAVHDRVRTHRHALRELADKEGLTDADIDEHIRAIGELEQEMSKLRAAQVDGLRDILSPEQRLAFVLTRAKIERELRRALRERRMDERRERRDRDGERRRMLEDERR